MLFSIHWFNRTYNIESTIVMVLEYVTFTALYIYISHPYVGDVVMTSIFFASGLHSPGHRKCEAKGTKMDQDGPSI